MQPDEIAALFTRADGQYLCARWQRPIVPVVFGVEESTLSVLKGACEAVVALAGHQMAETDPEMGANLFVFFFRDWAELLSVPDLDRMVPDLSALVGRLAEAGANQYRVFRFEESGAIRACVLLLRMDPALSALPAEDLCLDQMVRVILSWSDAAFARRSALLRAPEGPAILRPEIAALIRACYDPILPPVARDASHALRVAARLPRGVSGAN